MNNHINQKGFVNIALIVLIILIVSGAAGYFYWTQKTTTPVEQAQTTNTAQQQPIPPTTKNAQPPTSPGETASWKIFRSERFGFEVKYPPNYVVENNYEHTYPDQGHIHFYKETDYKKLFEYRAQDRPVEGWPSIIEFSFYANPQKLSALEWAQKNGGHSNFSGKYTTQNIAGQSALSYSWSGLGGGDTLVFTKNDYGYIASLEIISIDNDVDLKDDFLKIVSTFKFTE